MTVEEAALEIYLRGLKSRIDGTRFLDAELIAAIINAQRAQAVAKAMAWQPIECAPKDGTIIWACERSYWQAPVYCHKNELGQEYWFPAYFNTSDYPLNPTHWVPLPAPPERGMKG